MRRVLLGLALLCAVPSAAHADPRVFGTYIFEGCIRELSCHRAVITTSDGGFDTHTMINIDLFSFFLRPAGVYVVDFKPDHNDPDQLGGMCARTGHVQDWLQSYYGGGGSWIPTSIDLMILTGPAALGQCIAEDPGVRWVSLSLVNQSTVPEPITMALLAPGLGALAVARRRRRFKTTPTVA